MGELRATIHIRTVYSDEFQEIKTRRQLFIVVRANEREVRVGDTISLNEIDADTGERTGSHLVADVTRAVDYGHMIIGISPRPPAVGKSIYERALVVFGVDKQLGNTIEECAELIVAIRHYDRARVSTEKIAEECADVENMCAQVRLVVGHDVVDKIKQYKLERFEKILAAAEANNAG